jgi:hypothetical protein
MTRKAARYASASLKYGLAALVAFGSPLTILSQHDSHNQTDSSRLVEIVRHATQQYQNVANAVGYSPTLGCVSGSDHGAMGVHFVNGNLVNGETLLRDGQLDPTKPQALIYEPSKGEYQLVGVEFIILAGALPPGSAPPQVDGHLMVYVDSPNRYGLPPFYELHVWAWRDNPEAPFADWNNHVTCAHE